MQEAYDIAYLMEKLKAAGLVEVEKTAKIVVAEVFAWASESAKMSATPVDDIVAPVLSYAKDIIMAKLDPISPA